MAYNIPWIDVGRVFMPYKDEEDWELAYYNFGDDRYFGAENWEQLLQHRCSVVLAEAGAGKTAEMRENARLLNKNKDITAFYFPLEVLTRRSLADTLATVRMKDAFDEWLEGDQEAIFLADSLDEARLNNITFGEALANLKEGIGEQIGRARIIISCRVSDWDDFQDKADLEAFFFDNPDRPPAPSETPINPDDALLNPLFKEQSDTDTNDDNDTEQETQGVHVVALAPLTRDQAKQIAIGHGINNVKAFLNAIDRTDASDLATRPLDLVELAQYWREHGNISSKLAVLEWAVRLRLRETSEKKRGKDNLSLDRATEGARRIAAAMTLGKKRFIAWPGEHAALGNDQVALAPAAVLTDWSAADQKLLMSRAIFDPASNGRVRFHNREVQEMLAADWFLEQIEKGLPVISVWQLLSEEKYGKTRIRPTLRPIAAWLAQKNSRIRTKLIEVAPEALIEYGDPGGMALPVKISVLDKFAKIYAGRDDGGVSIDIRQVRWLAEPGLAPKIRELWRLNADGGEIRELLLRLVWVGGIAECTDIALEAATQLNHSYQASLGARAIEVCGSDEQKKKLRTYIVRNRRRYHNNTLPVALLAARSYLTKQDIVKLATDAPLPARNVVHSGIGHALSELFKSHGCPEPNAVIRELFSLLQKKPQKGTWSQKYRHLRSPLLELLAWQASALDDKPFPKDIAKIIRTVAIKTKHSGDYQINESYKGYSEAIRSSQIVNRQQLHLAIANSIEKGFGAWSFRQGLSFDAIWELSEKSFSWVVQDLSKKKAFAYRERLLNAAYGIFERNGSTPAQLKQIRKALADSKKLQRTLETLINPPPREKTDWEIKEEQQKQIYQQREITQKTNISNSWLDFRDRLRDDPRAFQTNPAFGDLCDFRRWLGWSCGHDVEQQSNWRSLEPAFGAAVAAIARDAIVTVWREYDPIKLFRQSKITNGLEVGRLGLEIEAQETQDWPGTLGQSDVARATRYLMCDIGDVSRTANLLWTARPEDVERQLEDEIKYEFRRKEGDNRPRFIGRFAWAEEPLRSIFANWLIDVMQEMKPASVRSLSDSLHVISGANQINKDQLLAAAQKHFSSSKKLAHRVRWLAVWLGVEADSGVTALQAWLDAQRTREKKDTIVILLFSYMFEDRHYSLGSKLQDIKKLNPLTQLVRLAYQHIRREEDIEHEGSYSPGDRDRAQDARNAVLNMFLDIRGEETVRTLLSLRDEVGFEWSHERFEVLADRCAMRDTDIEPWSAQQVVEFCKTREKPPRSVGELAGVVMERLIDIQDEIENGQFSNKAQLRQDHINWPKNKHDERVVQLGIAKELNVKRGDVYSPVREEEQEDRNEPDITIHRPGLPHHIPIEIKIADSWSYNQLVQTIELQIIQKYLKPAAATHGFMVITWHGKRKEWRPGGERKPLNFLDLVEDLKQQAIAICKNYEFVESICVLGIDLRK